MKSAPRSLKHPRTIRAEAAAMARRWANERMKTGDPEGAGELRALAAAIGRIKLTEIAP